MVIPCLSSFLLTVLRTPAVELPVNKKRTRTHELYGGRYRTRTCDLLHVKQMLYQLS